MRPEEGSHCRRAPAAGGSPFPVPRALNGRGKVCSCGGLEAVVREHPKLEGGKGKGKGKGRAHGAFSVTGGTPCWSL